MTTEVPSEASTSMDSEPTPEPEYRTVYRVVMAFDDKEEAEKAAALISTDHPDRKVEVHSHLAHE